MDRLKEIIEKMVHIVQKPKKGEIIQKLKAVYITIRNDPKKEMLAIIMGCLFISIYFVTLLIETNLMVKGEIAQMHFNPFIVLYIWLVCIKQTIFLTVLFTGILIYLAYYLKRIFTKDYVYDKERNVKVAKEGMYGNAHFMTDEEKQKAMFMSKDPNEIMEDIFGYDKYGVFYARKPVRFTNGNVIVIGPPGCGKTTCMLEIDVLQNIKRGESFIIIDSKGGIYKDTAYAAEKAGYNVKIFNTRPREIQCSDGVDYFKIITNAKLAKGEANSLASTLMLGINIETDVRKDIWYKGAYNLIKAMILITKFDNELPENKRTLGQMYLNLVNHASVPELEAAYGYVGNDRKHPAYEAWRTFVGAKAIKESILGGVLTDLSFLADDYVREMVSHDEIDFTAPGFEKCAYYVVIDDQDKSNNALASLFVECCTMELKKAADAQKDGRLPITVNIEIDEFKNVGKLPSMGEKLSSYRSRGMNIKLIVQDLSQLQIMYPREAWRELIADVTTMLILKVGEQGTAAYLEKEFGTQTAIVDNIRDKRTKLEPVHLQLEYQSTQGKGQRPLMYLSELMGDGTYGLKDDELVVRIKGQSPIILKKWFWGEHPIAKALHLMDESRNRPTHKHIPEWYKHYMEEEAFEERKRKQIHRQVVNIPTGKMVTVDLSSSLGKKEKPNAENNETRKIPYAKRNSL